MARSDINDVLAAAQARLTRLEPAQVAAAIADGWTLIDTRAGDDRREHGAIPGAVHVPLSVLEWRVDAASGHADPALLGRTDRLVLICTDGYSSSLAAVRLQELGFANTTNVVGGFVAWAAAGMPIRPLPRTALGAASVLVDPRGRVLLVHHTYGALNWELPGGGTEPDESVEETAIREAREEVGVTLAARRLTGVYWEPTWGPGGLHHFVFRTSLAPGSPEPHADLNEISECAWFDVAALPRPLSDFTVRRIDDALSDRPAGLFVVPARRWLR